MSSALPEQQALEGAIEQLYAVFRRYPRRDLTACDDCVTGEDHHRLMARPLRQLEEADFGMYPRRAMTTWGDADDFRHFLPRLLELIADNCLLDASIVLLSKLPCAGWREWPVDEQRAVEHYLDRLWDRGLADADAGGLAWWDVHLCHVLNALGVDLAPYLMRWEGRLNTRPAAVRAAQLTRWLLYPPRSQLALPQAAANWLRQPVVKESIESAYLDNGETSAGETLVAALDLL
jgi:hypothetical protein